MKRIYVLRHSKAGQTNKNILDDHERPLTDKGIDLCKKIGQHFKSLGTPELCICSTASRCRETALHTFVELGKEIPTQYLPRLYLASAEDIFSMVHDLDAEDPAISSVAIIGHNPGLQQFCMMLTAEGDRKQVREMKTYFPPGALAAFDVHANNWAEVIRKSGTLVDYAHKKMF